MISPFTIFNRRLSFPELRRPQSDPFRIPVMSLVDLQDQGGPHPFDWHGGTEQISQSDLLTA